MKTDQEITLKSIKSKIIVFATMATFIPSLGLGLLSFQQTEALISDNVTRELRSLANYASRELDLWAIEQIHVVRELSTSNAVIGGLSAIIQPNPNASKSRNSPQALALYLRAVNEKLNMMLELTVVDTNGQLVASSTATPTTVTIPQHWPQDALTKGVVTISPHWNAQHSTAILSVAIPVLSYDDFVIGALVATLDLRTIQPNLKDATKSPSGDVLLLDSDGKALLGSRAEVDHSMSLDPSLLRQLQGQLGESMVFQGILQRKVIGLAYMSAAPAVTIVAERDHADVYNAWVKLRNLFLVLVSILILIVTVIALRMGHSIVAPLQRLIGATKRIVEGDLNVRLAVTQNDEIGQLTRMFNQMTDKLRHNHAEITAANIAMQQQNELLETLSVTDGLTGLYNRSKLDMILNNQLARFGRNQRPFAVLMIDVDHFKTLNDNLGHLAGDEILTAVAKILAESIRSVDFAARYGGDEFFVILTESTVDMALKMAERIRSQVGDIRYSSSGQSVTVTLSIGIVQCTIEDTTPTALLARVDTALYEAKRTGRNQAYCIQPGGNGD